MKINWGKGIVIAFALFMSFILYFVVTMITNPKYDNEMVVEEYYKVDAEYGSVMEQLNAGNALKEKVKISHDADAISVVFPSDFPADKIHGLVTMYRPSDKKLDFEVPIKINESELKIPADKLAGGVWKITVAWNYSGKDYMTTEQLYL